ncbi:hypothetical protein [Pedobacter gandavensis]|uniref:hypothetical protein n=1 Tax=Pedobacter gandavensis TaxID=2679963 RepID=UPI00292DCA0B|nr:hypothetical protein [Pedobacter gandavensis]
MRYLYLVIVFIVFVCLVSYFYHSGKERTVVRDRVMFNDLLIQGEVIEIKTSRNHRFGILLLKLDSINTGRFVDTLLDEGIYPYKVKDRKAEVYVGIPAGIQKGDKVIVDSDKKMAFYHYIVEDKHYKCDLGIVIDPSDIDYIKENTAFK